VVVWGGNVGDLVMSGKEALNLPRRLEPLHDPLSSSGRLMGVFGPVIEALVLPMLDPGHDLPLGRGVALQLVGDEHTRGSTVLLEELSEQALGGLLVAPALNQDIENEAMLVDGTSEPMLFPGDADDDLIQVPFVATANSRPNLRPHCRIVSWVTQMPRAASISSTMRRLNGNRKYTAADDLGGVAMAGVNRVSKHRHPARLSDQPGSDQACSRPT